MEVEYFGFFDAPGPYPEVNVRGAIVLCDGQSVVNDSSIAREVTELGLLLLGSASTSVVRQKEYYAAFKQLDSQAKDSFYEQLDWHKRHQDTLGKYVSGQTLARFLHVSMNKLTALEQRALAATRALKVLSATVQCCPVPADQIRALRQLHLRTGYWNVRNTQALLEAGVCARQLFQELSNQRTQWERNDTASDICQEALRIWQLVAKAEEQTRGSLDEADRSEVAFEQRNRAGWAKLVDERLGVYRIPVVEKRSDADMAKEHLLGDTELDRIVESLPPMPKHPPWRTRAATRVFAYVGIGLGMVVALTGVGLSVLRMVGGGMSFPVIVQALFFASWLFILPRYLKRL
jgi:hypothetical protein